MKKVLILLIFITILQTGKSQNYFVTTIVGDSIPNLLDGIGTAAECNAPYELVNDGVNTIYFCDTYNHAIRKYNKTTGQVTTIAGNGNVGYQDGPCTTARFNYPEGIVYRNGFLYIGDNYNHCIRKIDLGTNMVSTLAGSATPGYQDGPAASAQFHNPKYLTMDKSGDLYVGDCLNFCVRKISGGQVSTIAGIGGVSGYVDGPGNTAKFNTADDLCCDTITGDIYVTDNNNHVIRKIDSFYNVTTYAGTGVSGHVDGPKNSAQFVTPSTIDITSNGTLYLGFGAGGDNTIRKIDPSGMVSTVAGTYGNSGFQDGPGPSAKFYWVYGVCYDPSGVLYIADSFNNRLRKIIVPEVFSVKELEEIDFKIFPNPGTGLLNFNFTGNASYFVFNITGSQLKSGLVINGLNKIDISDLDNGIYFVVIRAEKGAINKKIILQK